MPPSSRSASVTTGLKCAPDTEPNARISATSAAPVAMRVLEQLQADVVRARALRGDARSRRRSRRGAPVPTASARRPAARGRGRSTQQQRAADSGARRAAHRVVVGLDGAQLAGGHLDVGRAPCRSPTARRRGRRPRPCPGPRSSTTPRPRWRWRGPRRSGGRCVAPTSSVDSTSTPRWFSVPGAPCPSMSTSLSGGSAMAKLA